ncbi:hypothetical protein MUK42_21856 [Musa troglodytarum]|uniref:Uncharacterized protein n=1 Tax=Musa troglodytarum TaxID=320322 RepID=A0A9E7G6Y7_9LILI|nr:hypothetical protein MUK42_21856 [Musa troglodytarum]
MLGHAHTVNSLPTFFWVNSQLIEVGHVEAFTQKKNPSLHMSTNTIRMQSPSHESPLGAAPPRHPQPL